MSLSSFPKNDSQMFLSINTGIHFSFSKYNAKCVTLFCSTLSRIAKLWFTYCNVFLLWWQTDSVGVNTHIRTYAGSWPQSGPMATLSQIPWQDIDQSESRWRTNALAGMKPFLLKLFSWYRRAKHSGVTFFRIIPDITGPQSARQCQPRLW